MVIKEIQEYANIRTKARAYLCYIMSRNISLVNLESGTDSFVEHQLKILKDNIPQADLVYALNAQGQQIGIMLTAKGEVDSTHNIGTNRSNRAYYYRTLKEHRCVLTDPYPSLGTNKMVVTSSFPIYDEKNNLMFILCVDIQLKDILKMVYPSSVDSNFGQFSKVVYGAFSVALFAVALLLFVKGVSSFLSLGTHYSTIDINDMFQATILLTLALAIFDLVKAIFEEEVLGKEKKESDGDAHQTMIRFLGSIIIALSIEALMLVFKFALTDPEKLLYAVYLIGGITALMIGLSIYIKSNKMNKNK
ncbi:PDC sensor domain-containing protein [bacterium]|nr:PDC sensor domain-containing protein [bacterium]MBU1957716.1 PDC sensor domain-containing protein [bacterium]